MKIQSFRNIREIPSSVWESLPLGPFPFASRSFLLALEENHCLGARTGWEPHVLVAWDDATKKPRGLLLQFAKTNSYGEYIFDFGWADAYERSGLSYFPKLVSAIPFTPATGPKLLLSGGQTSEEQTETSRTLLAAVSELVQSSNASSFHALFIPENELRTFEEAGFFIRHSFQYHWRNHGYQNFTSFTEKLRSKRRREVMRERAQAHERGLRIERLTGSQLKPEHAEWMYEFYLSTVEKMGGYGYLTRGFFEQVFRTMGEQILFVLASTPDGKPVAGALNFFGEDTLFGRHWGCLEEYRALHFEVCYYQGIEFAIERGFSLFEAGAQGEHKFQRGFLPALTYSAHSIRHPQLRAAIEDFVQREKQQIEMLFADYADSSPFQRN